jgi:hypothetical protein
MTIEAYNKYLNIFINVSEGEELCPKCLGKGVVPLRKILKEKRVRNLTCNECLGKGKLDWVEKAMRR